MPGGDRTGPMGEGPRTGRGLGYCSGADQPGYATPGPGLGRGWGRGWGRGRGWGLGRGGGWGLGRGGGWGRGAWFQRWLPAGQTAAADAPYPDEVAGRVASPGQEQRTVAEEIHDLEARLERLTARVRELKDQS